MKMKALKPKLMTIFYCPDFNIRIGKTLHILYPINGPLACTDTRCSFRGHQALWAEKKGKLIEHLRTTHNICIEKAVKWCNGCKTDIIEFYYTKKHRGLTHIAEIQTIEGEYEDLPFKCKECDNFATDNKRSLHQHIRKHKRKRDRI